MPDIHAMKDWSLEADRGLNNRSLSVCLQAGDLRQGRVTGVWHVGQQMSVAVQADCSGRGSEDTVCLPPSARWQVYAPISLDDVPPESVQAIHTDDQLWPAKGIRSLVSKVQGVVPDE